MNLYSSLVGIGIAGAILSAGAAIMSRLSADSVMRLKSGQWTIGAGSASLAAVVLAVVLRFYEQHSAQGAAAPSIGEFISGHPMLTGIAALAVLSLLLGNTATNK